MMHGNMNVKLKNSFLIEQLSASEQRLSYVVRWSRQIQVCSYCRYNIFRPKHVNVAGEESSTICVFFCY